MFVRHARGLVGGKEVDLEELKRTLLALQKKWNPSECRYENCESLHRRIEGFHVGIFFSVPFNQEIESSVVDVVAPWRFFLPSSFLS